jgi:ABC-type transporter Mla maintaining outer membrane lipid asymmetry ATPase subunit MlaF
VPRAHAENSPKRERPAPPLAGDRSWFAIAGPAGFAAATGTSTATDVLMGDAPVIELRDVSLAFGDKRVLDHLDLQIAPGRTTVIVGRGGSGKTVLLKLMLGLVHPDRGSVRLFGHDLATASEVELVELRRHVGMLFQNYALFDALSVEDNVEFPLHETVRMPKRDAVKLTGEILDLLGLAGNEDLLPAELSGGMRKRVGLARALVGRPNVVLFDEPTTGLDPLMVEKVDGMIALARREYGITSVVISHDLASVKRLADHVAFLHEGRVIFEGTYDELERCELAPVQAFVTAAHTRIEAAAAPASTSAPLIEVTGLHKSFGDKHVLRGIDLAIHPRQITFLIGGSGSGKTVLARHLMGLLRPDRGTIRVFGTDLATLDERALTAIRRRFGLVFQHAGLLDWLSVDDNIAFPLVEHGHSKHDARERVDDIVARIGLAGLRSRMPGELSPGERKRVALARAMVTRPEILIYDEPTTGQDPVRVSEIDTLIRETQEQFGITSLVISHDMASTFRLAHHIVMLHHGRVVARGTPRELLASPDEHVRRFLAAAGV